MAKSVNLASSRLATSVRALREAAGMSIGALARRALLSKTSVANIESGLANPSLETLVSLSEALGVGMSALLGVESESEPHLIRADEGAPFRSQSGLEGRLLLAESRTHRTELMEIRLDQNANYEAGPHPPGTQEVVFCVEGQAAVGPQGQEVDLGPGDTVLFPADVPHSYRAANAARVILLMSYPPTALQSTLGAHRRV